MFRPAQNASSVIGAPVELQELLAGLGAAIDTTGGVTAQYAAVVATAAREQFPQASLRGQRLALNAGEVLSEIEQREEGIGNEGEGYHYEGDLLSVDLSQAVTQSEPGREAG